MAIDKLVRYTDLPYVLQMLKSKSLTLLNPASWDDKNDAHYVECYRKKKDLMSVLALCLTEASQTYHHWRIFTQGSSGACIYFKRGEFLDWLKEQKDIVGRKVIYRTVKQLKDDISKNKIELDDIPFIKRKAYQHEAEFRLIFDSLKSSKKFENFTFPLATIEQIVLNPWLPQSTVSAIRQLIQSMDGCKELPVLRATIIENNDWRSLADGI
ncbi:hypothetical protein FHW83_003989 [Duganella sp. SG902]|uniref:DUF2971 domain-containing protein n=1 Tax=Duganella sp. SG902 TaxID=2587016 RepID=UPI00159E86B1|nr:DUF2971 domain-containing protein [Duganella sp. SG902]NVM78165.1 hypothetical protein [Duganella sp. SG902]